MSANVEKMAFAGQLPWHGIGTQITENDWYDLEKVIVASGLNWEAEKVGLITGDTHEKVDYYAIRRKNDGKILGTVGPRYTILQNRKAFEWFDPFLQSKQAALHTAGSLMEGSRIWILAKLNRDPIVVAKDDEVDKYLLLSHSHDGTLAVRVGFTPVRVVCCNTLAMAHTSDASKLIRVRHSASVHENLENIREVMDLANQEFNATAEQYKLLARKEINQKDLRKYIRLVLGVDEKLEDKELPKRTFDRLEKIVEFAEYGKGNTNPAVRNSYWTAYNGVSEYLSWEAGRNPSSRFNSLWFGKHSVDNRKALDAALELAMSS